jgi:REP element-mobilizing transposase RayT
MNAQVLLSDAGQIVAEEWLRTPMIRREITLDEWVVMPDHFQAIVWINGIVGAGGCPPGDGGTGQCNPIGGPKPRSLSILIAQFKATTTRRINELWGTAGQKVWQRNYNDRIIHNDVALDKVREYIRNNPRQ